MLPVGRRKVELVVRMGHSYCWGKGKDALKGLWGRLRRSQAKIQAVATDMASGYIAAVLQHLPRADLGLDHFHLVKWFNEKLALLCRQLYHQATDMQKAVLKGSRWLLLKPTVAGSQYSKTPPGSYRYGSRLS